MWMLSDSSRSRCVRQGNGVFTDALMPLLGLRGKSGGGRSSLDSQLRTAIRRPEQNKIGERAVPLPFRYCLAPLMLVALASAASAQTAASQPQQRTRAQVTQGLDARFKVLDANGDGSVTK